MGQVFHGSANTTEAVRRARSCPSAWCRSDDPGRAGPLFQAGTADRLTGAVSLTALMVSSVM